MSKTHFLLLFCIAFENNMQLTCNLLHDMRIYYREGYYSLLKDYLKSQFSKSLISSLKLFNLVELEQMFAGNKATNWSR